MTFGKFNGQRVEALPLGYLGWLYDQPWFPLRYPGLKREVEHVIAARIGATIDVPPQRLLEDDLADAAQDLITAGYRRLATENHPDHRGDPRRMTAINLAREFLSTEVANARPPEVTER